MGHQSLGQQKSKMYMFEVCNLMLIHQKNASLFKITLVLHQSTFLEHFNKESFFFFLEHFLVLGTCTCTYTVFLSY